MQITNEGYQARLRTAITLATREEQLLDEIKQYNSPDQLSKNPIQKLSPATCFGSPEFSIKTLWSDDDSVFRNEYEAKVGGSPDILGMYLTQMKKNYLKTYIMSLKTFVRTKKFHLA